MIHYVIMRTRLVLCLFIFFAIAGSVQATEVSLEDRIRQLESELAFLRAKISQTTTEAVRFDRALGIGSVGEDVRRLQVFLNSNSETRIANVGAGSPGNETTYYGALTALGVKKFQASRGLTQSGAFDSLTRITVNGSLFGGSVVAQQIVEPATDLDAVRLAVDVSEEEFEDISKVFEDVYRDSPHIFDTNAAEVYDENNPILQALEERKGEEKELLERYDFGMGGIEDGRLFDPFGGKIVKAHYCTCFLPQYLPDSLLIFGPVIEIDDNTQGNLKLSFTLNILDIFGIDIFSKAYKWYNVVTPNVNTVGTYNDLVKLQCYDIKSVTPPICTPDLNVGETDGIIRTIGTSLLPSAR